MVIPPKKPNWSKQPRQNEAKEEQLPVISVKRMKVLGPKEPYAFPVPAPTESLVQATEVWSDPKIPPRQRRDLHIFYSSLVVAKRKPTIVRELDEDWPFDEDMDPDLAEAWRPLMDEPLLPFVIGLRDFLRK